MLFKRFMIYSLLEAIDNLGLYTVGPTITRYKLAFHWLLEHTYWESQKLNRTSIDVMLSLQYPLYPQLFYTGSEIVEINSSWKMYFSYLCALGIVSIEWVYTQSTFYMKSAVGYIIYYINSLFTPKVHENLKWETQPTNLFASDHFISP